MSAAQIGPVVRFSSSAMRSTRRSKSVSFWPPHRVEGRLTRLPSPVVRVQPCLSSLGISVRDEEDDVFTPEARFCTHTKVSALPLAPFRTGELTLKVIGQRQNQRYAPRVDPPLVLAAFCSRRLESSRKPRSGEDEGFGAIGLGRLVDRVDVGAADGLEVRCAVGSSQLRREASEEDRDSRCWNRVGTRILASPQVVQASQTQLGWPSLACSG